MTLDPTHIAAMRSAHQLVVSALKDCRIAETKSVQTGTRNWIGIKRREDVPLATSIQYLERALTNAKTGVKCLETLPPTASAGIALVSARLGAKNISGDLAKMRLGNDLRQEYRPFHNPKYHLSEARDRVGALIEDANTDPAAIAKADAITRGIQYINDDPTLAAALAAARDSRMGELSEQGVGEAIAAIAGPRLSLPQR